MTERTITQLLAGVIDLTPAGETPHPPGSCSALTKTASVGANQTSDARDGPWR
jgi:hypothetical protein